MVDWNTWRVVRAQEQRHGGVYSRLDQLPPGARVIRPERQQTEQQPSLDPEQAARMGMEG